MDDISKKYLDEERKFNDLYLEEISEKAANTEFKPSGSNQILKNKGVMSIRSIVRAVGQPRQAHVFDVRSLI
ncbi:hypothetical protein EVAR_31160_1 [Eumeta japonica]|uniref:Uncharacterized protein n=1 Tax=Eumeta variegata TaxID=151549 RepID=A0A4C1VZL2_EUMVA|nr:hypothetical protein EVAR_31160_1 [Eumeta japonica]